MVRLLLQSIVISAPKRIFLIHNFRCKWVTLPQIVADFFFCSVAVDFLSPLFFVRKSDKRTRARFKRLFLGSQCNNKPQKTMARQRHSRRYSIMEMRQKERERELLKCCSAGNAKNVTAQRWVFNYATRILFASFHQKVSFAPITFSNFYNKKM